MAKWRDRTDDWLRHEDRGLDDAAEESFGQLFAALPVAEPGAGFVQRAVDAAWLARALRRRQRALAGIAAALVAGLGISIGYGVLGLAGGRLLAVATDVMTSSTLATLISVTTVLAWWEDAARLGNAVISVMGMAQGAAMLAAVELTGAAALYALHRLLRADVRWHPPGPMCV